MLFHRTHDEGIKLDKAKHTYSNPTWTRLAALQPPAPWTAHPLAGRTAHLPLLWCCPWFFVWLAWHPLLRYLMDLQRSELGNL